MYEDGMAGDLGPTTQCSGFTCTDIPALQLSHSLHWRAVFPPKCHQVPASTDACSMVGDTFEFWHKDSQAFVHLSLYMCVSTFVHAQMHTNVFMYACVCVNVCAHVRKVEAGLNADRVRLTPEAKLGFCWQFITLAGFHCDALSIDRFAKDGVALRGLVKHGGDGGFADLGLMDSNCNHM